MSAFAIAQIKLKDKEKLVEYQKLAGATFAAYGAEPIAKGKVAGTVCGSTDLDLTVVIKFPSVEKIDEWYNSAEYQATIAIRDEACDMTIIKVQAA